MHVSAIDPSDGRSFEEWFAVLHVTDLERRPEGPGWPRAERLGLALDHDGPEEHGCLVARRAPAILPRPLYPHEYAVMCILMR
jgi:hypothetical protein